MRTHPAVGHPCRHVMHICSDSLVHTRAHVLACMCACARAHAHVRMCVLTYTHTTITESWLLFCDRISQTHTRTFLAMISQEEFQRVQFAVAGLADASVMREGENMFTLDPSVIISRQRENLSKMHREVRRWACSHLTKTKKTRLLVCSSHLPLVVCAFTQYSCCTDVPTYMQRICKPI